MSAHTEHHEEDHATPTPEVKSAWERIGWPKLLVMIFVVILSITVLIIYAVKKSKHQKEPTEQTTNSNNEKVSILKHGTYHVTITPYTWTRIGKIPEGSILDTDGFGERYQIKSNCEEIPQTIGGGLPTAERKPCEYIYLRAINKSTYIEYTLR